jgi:hypothetical protein
MKATGALRLKKALTTAQRLEQVYRELSNELERWTPDAGRSRDRGCFIGSFPFLEAYRGRNVIRLVIQQKWEEERKPRAFGAILTS